jgi:GcrA cell cycle regulator
MNTWTQDQLEMLEAHFKDGLSCTESARLINRQFSLSLSRNSVIGKRHRMGMVRGISYSHFKTNIQRAHEMTAKNAVYNATRRLKRAERMAKQKATKERQREINGLKEAVRNAMETEKEQPIALLSTYTRKAVDSLKRGDCRFPIGVVGAPDFHFCCEPQDKGSSYCKTHRAICTVYVPLKMKVPA